jgi:hypothetical protein
MTGQDFQDRLDAIVADLQTRGKGQTVNIMFRESSNSPLILPLSSDANGVVNAVQLQAIQDFLSDVITNADDYETQRAPVSAALEAFKLAQAPHEALMTAATNARKTLSDALEADPAYQTAKQALDTARRAPAYVSAARDYEDFNVSENYAALGQAKGEYII